MNRRERQQLSSSGLPVASKPVFFVSLAVCLVLVSSVVSAADYFSRNGGTWTGNNRWSTVGCGGASAGGAEPLVGDSATICNGHRITLNTSIAGAGLTFLTINAGGQLQMANSNTSRTLTVAGNVSNAGTLIMPTNRNTTSVLNTGGNITNTGTFDLATDANSLVTTTFTGGGSHSIDGNGAMRFSNLTANNNLTINKTGGVVTQTGNFSVNGNLVITAGTLNLEAASTVTGATGINGTLGHTTATGTRTFTDVVTINPGGVWSNSANVVIIMGNNFTNNGTFTAASSTVNFNGLAAQSVSGTAVTTFNNMGLNNAAGLTLNIDASINGALNIATGRITTGANALSINATGSVSRCVSGTDCFVVGNLIKAIPAGNPAISWEVGTEAVSPAYAPVDISFSGATAGDFQVSTQSIAGDHPDTLANSSGIDPGNSVNRYWTLTSISSSFSSYSPTFNYGNIPGDVDGTATPANFIIRRKNAGVWNDTVTAGVPTGTSAGAVGVSSAAGDDFAIGETQLSGPGLCDPGVDLASGISGEYFNIAAIPPTPLPGGTPAGTRVDAPIDFNWGTGTPGVAGVAADQFAVRWDGRVRVAATGNYLFQTVSDDGVRLWVNDVLVIDNWTNHSSATDTSGTVALIAGLVYTLRLEYFENGGFSEIRLRWQRPADGGFTPIPAGPLPVPGEGLYHCPPPPPPSDIVVTLAGTATNINAGSVLLTGTLNGAPETVNTGTNTGVATITTNIATVTDNAWLLDVVGSGNAGSFTPGGGQTEAWDTSANTSTGAASTRPVPIAGGSSMSQTHSTASPRNAQAVIALAPGAASLIALDSVFSANINDAASLGWAHTVPFDFNGKLVVGITVEDQPDCTGDQLVSSVTHEGVPLTFVTSVTTPAAGICMHVEIWYLDFGNPSEPFTCSSGLSSGIIGEYFNVAAPPATPLPVIAADGTRTDGPINFNWGGGSPGVLGIGADDFAVRWDGVLRVTETGNFRFQTNSDDGVRLWLSDVLIIDNWTDHGPTLDTSSDIPLIAGQIYPLRLEYYENGGGAVIQLSWERPSDGSFSIIPVGPTPVLGEGLYRCTTVFLDHYLINHSGSGVSCLSQSITISAVNNSGGAFDVGNVTINLSVDPVGPGVLPPKGNWVRVSNGTGILSNQSANGTADYQFPGNGETSVTLVFNYTALETGNLSETLNFNVLDAINNITDTRDSSLLTDPDLVMALTGFQFYNEDNGNEIIPTQIAGKPSNIAPNDATLSLRAVRASDTDPTVCTAAFPDMSVISVPLAAECLNPGSCAGRQLRIINNGNTVAVATNADDSGAGTSVYTNVNLLFEATGPVSRARIAVDYPDVGEMQLHARYEVPLDEGGAPPSGAGSGGFMLGASNPFVVRPFGFAVGAIANADAVPNPGVDIPAGAVFTSAGTDFQAAVGAFVWQSADDDGSSCDLVVDPACAANDGIPDTGADLLDNNGGFPESVALNFQGMGAVDVTLSAVAPFEPNAGIGGIPGQLLDSVTGISPIVSAAAFANGIATISTINYSEVGSMTLRANAANYLGSGESVIGRSSNLAINPNNGVVGRFIPFDFDVGFNVPEFATACTGFTYIGQPFAFSTDPLMTVTARAKGGSVTQNYTGAYNRLSATSLNFPGGSNEGFREGSVAMLGLDTGLITGWGPGINDQGNGVTGLTFSFGLNERISFNRLAPSEPFAAEISLEINVVDEDGVVYGDGTGNALNPARFGDTGIGSGISFDAGKGQRWGRLSVGNAFGSELLPLAFPLSAEYFLDSISGFVPNTDDNCTNYQAAEAGIIDPDPLDSLNPGDVGVLVPVSTTTLVGGRENPAGLLLLSNPVDSGLGPGAGKTGTMLMTLDISVMGSGQDWLQFDWMDMDGLGDGPYDANPSGRATFGIFRGSGNFIYIREPWN